MYAAHEKVDHRTRLLAYAKAMEALAQRHPDDDEAQIHYALSLNTSASPADKTYANQLKGGALLEPIFKRQPAPPAIAHYMIHLYDYPPIADRGLDAARRYAKIAPAAAHAQHMPSHIFTRLGLWDNSITSKVESVGYSWPHQCNESCELLSPLLAHSGRAISHVGWPLPARTEAQVHVVLPLVSKRSAPDWSRLMTQPT